MKKILLSDIEKELAAITHQFLVDSGESHQREIKMDVSLHRHLGMDSLGRAELFQRIEKSFDVKISDRLLAEADTLRDIANYLYEIGPDISIQTNYKIISSHGERVQVDAARVRTLLDILFFYGEKSPDATHIYFQHEEGHEEIITYGQLLHTALKVAAGLQACGLNEGETVAIMQPTSPEFFYTFFGALLAGGIPVPIYPPFRLHMLEAYAKIEAHILNNAEVRILVTFEQAKNLSLILQSFVPSLKQVTTVDELIHQEQTNKIVVVNSDSSALIQYTSGSTSNPKGVLLNHHNLLANIHAYGRAINVTSNDIAVSWLPLYHDMGLIGMWLGSLYYGIPLILLTPFSFLNHPERWLWAIHYHRGTLSGAPNFGYELCVRKIDSGLLEGLDLSSWRMAANGAEKIYPRTLEQFAKKFAPFGFKRNALLPVYGLAESTVSLTIPPIGRDFNIDRVDRKQFEEERHAIPEKAGKNTLEFVSCGSVIEGHAIRIVDDNNCELPERRVGNLQFRGPSSMQGFYNNPRATQMIYHDGWLDSGDLAYQAAGEVYITGRKKDLIIKAGRNLYPAEIEELVGKIEGVRQGCVTAFGVTDALHGTEKLIIVAETREKNSSQQEKMTASINEVIATALDTSPDHVVLVPPYVVPKTSSGKLQRSACKIMYLEGKLDAHIPAWLQIIKLGSQYILQKGMRGLSLVIKFVYTLYVALIISMCFLPLFVLIKYSSRAFAAKSIRTWAKWVLRLAFCPIKVVGIDKLTQRTPVIFAANHASYIDSMVMVSVLPTNVRIVVKKELMHVPFVRTIIKKLDYLDVDRMDWSKSLEDTKQIEAVLIAKHPILIFPEGTFGYPSGLRPFRLGAFKIAADTNVAVCPIALKGTRYILRSGERLMRPRRVTVTVGDLIHPSGTNWEDVIQLKNLVRAEIAKHCGEPSLDFIVAQTIAST